MITRRWSVFLYAMMISFFAVIIGYIISIKMDTLIENLDIQNYDSKLHSNLTEKADFSIEYDLLLNSNSGGSAYDNDDFFYTNSTWSTDDDDLARKTLYGYIKKNIGWYNGFIINTPIRKYITGNIFNSGSNSVIASDTQTGYLRLDIDNPYNIKIVELDKVLFDSIKELRILTGATASFSTGGIGWIMPDLSLTGLKSQAKVFDLKNKDYALFLSFSGNLTNTWVDFLRYKLTMENENGSGVYIVPIDESWTGIIKYLGEDIIIDREGDYRYKQFEIVK